MWEIRSVYLLWSAEWVAIILRQAPSRVPSCLSILRRKREGLVYNVAQVLQYINYNEKVIACDDLNIHIKETNVRASKKREKVESCKSGTTSYECKGI